MENYKSADSVIADMRENLELQAVNYSAIELPSI
jgi:hypothetical protein